jgi:hypothetical protein
MEYHVSKFKLFLNERWPAEQQFNWTASENGLIRNRNNVSES